jgi:hypothetical protein
VLINNQRIISDRFEITFIDGNKYIFNIKKLKNIINNLGNVYLKKNFGLPTLNFNKTDNEKKTDDEKKIISHGNLFFILLL